MYKLIDGKKLAATIMADVNQEIVSADIEPRLAVILVGDDAASKLYIKLKEIASRHKFQKISH
jgi:methylenetetrahydrofolate dehydrogenase (NADP+) / methenyltetrahydrofolate cyclohydrolase